MNRFSPLVLATLLIAGPAAGIPLDHLQTTDDIGLNKVPHVGKSHLLVIPVHVGPAGFSAEKLADLKKHFDPDGGPGTFRRFWQVMSGGKYDPVATVVDPIEYPDSCPLPGKTVDNCTVGFDDTDLIVSGTLKLAFADMLGRVRDEQNIDLGIFDVNGKDAGSPDGYFDGVLISSNIAEGVAPPLAALFNETIVKTKPGDTGPTLSMGNVAMLPPGAHEFGHSLGFIDLYGGPAVNGLMDNASMGLEAFSRQQIGWVDLVQVDESIEIDLPPAIDSQTVLRIGAPPRYMLIENRGGPLHDEFDLSRPGIYTYSIDEETLPTIALGFLDLGAGKLYLPNAEPPYLDVVTPIGCSLLYQDNGCAMDAEGQERPLTHASGTPTGFTIRVVGAPQADGTIRIQVFDESGPKTDPEPTAPAGSTADSGCSFGTSLRRPGVAPGVWALLLVLFGRHSTFRPRRLRRRRPGSPNRSRHSSAG